ncbi:MAG: hypothetical protein LBC77_03300 [Spirochaetaceae bacterium]|jgi:hypothetical protein|nr:hypothetical protein [Spirochaetaceae bacterium]
MGSFKEKITLENARNAGNAKENLIVDTQIRAVTVDAMPDRSVDAGHQ